MYLLGCKNIHPLIIAISVISILVVGTQSAHAVAFNQNVTESLGLTDGRNNNPTKALSDTLALADSIVQSVAKALTETLTSADALAKTYAKPLAENISLSDALTTTAQFIRNLNESLALADTNVRAFSRKLDETLTLVDAESARITVKNLGETLTLSDSVNARISVRNLSETLALSDAVAKSTTMNIAESLTISDTVNARITVKGLQESLTISDTVNARITVKNLGETIALSDAVANTVTKNIAETITLSDALSAGIIVKNLAETITLSDAVNARIIVKNLAETITLSDATPKVITRNIAESLTLSDAVNARTTVKGLQESLTFSDTVTAGVIFKNLAETLALSAATATGNVMTLSESLALSDAVVTSGLTPTSRAETMNLSDTVVVTHTIPTPVGTSVSNSFLGGQGEVGGGTITFSQVTTPGTVSVTTMTVVEPPTNGFTIIGLSGSTTALDITTAAGFTGTVQICLKYDDAGLTAEQEALLQLGHFTGGMWVTITTSLNTTDNIICGHSGSLSPFAVMLGPPQVGSGGSSRERPRYEINDILPPIMAKHYIKPEKVYEGDEVTVTAYIVDDVGVADAKVLYLTNIREGPPESHQVPMEKVNAEWWRGTILGSDVTTEGLSYWIAGIDVGGNVGNSAKVDLKVEKARPKAEQKTIPFIVQSKKVDLKANDFIEVSTIEGKKVVSNYSDSVVVRNNSNSTLHSVRIMLSPEISNSFHLDRYSIKSIEPYGNVTVSIKLLGNLNQDAYGKVTAYNGNIMIMAPNHNPVILPLDIIAINSPHYQTYMEMVADMTEQRYNKISLINTILKGDSIEKSDIEVKTRTGLREINTPSDEIVIKNLSNRTLNNIRVMMSNTGTAFLLDKYNIAQIEPNGEASIRMIPRMDTSKYTPRDYMGEVIIAPENAIPRAIPVYIPATPRHDSIDEFEVRIVGNEMTTAVDRIHIKNTGNRTMDSVKIMLSDNLARIFSLSEDSFKLIEPSEEVIVGVKYNAKGLKTFMQNYNGEIKIISEHHNMRIIPVKIQWNSVESDNFVIYARSGDLRLANNVLKHLESHYQNVTKLFGTVNHKATIYMTGSLEEMQLLNYYGYSFYSYTDDIIFICSCDAKDGALQEFIYRAMIRNFPSYHNMKKIDNDHGNWLIDGIAMYSVVKNNETAAAKYIDAFKTELVDFQWYGAATDARYGATIVFFRYLETVYGEDAIYRSLYYLGSGMVSNHRCDTVESCAVLRGVYDANGMDIDNKWYDLDFKTIVEEWYFNAVVQLWY